MDSCTILEGLLFIVGDEGADKSELLALFGNDEAILSRALKELKDKCNNDATSALQVSQFGTKYKLTTKTEHKEFYQQFFSTITLQQLSNAALEVLAIIAYNQPITRARIEYIRGVNSDGLIRKLQVFNLIEEVGREDSPGLPILFGVSDQFLDYFGLISIDELPALKETSLADISEEVDLFMTKYEEMEAPQVGEQ
jgi:segregation and condensation protein B